MKAYNLFAAAVDAVGLTPRRCSPTHWQIRGGTRIVNVWPDTKRGFVIQADGQKSNRGTTAAAIALARERADKAGDTSITLPAWTANAPREAHCVVGMDEMLLATVNSLEKRAASAEVAQGALAKRVASLEQAQAVLAEYAAPERPVGLVRRFLRWLI